MNKYTPKYQKQIPKELWPNTHPQILEIEFQGFEMKHDQDTGGEEWDAAVEAQRSQKSFFILHLSEVADVAVVAQSSQKSSRFATCSSR